MTDLEDLNLLDEFQRTYERQGSMEIEELEENSSFDGISEVDEEPEFEEEMIDKKEDF